MRAAERAISSVAGSIRSSPLTAQLLQVSPRIYTGQSSRETLDAVGHSCELDLAGPGRFDPDGVARAHSRVTEHRHRNRGLVLRREPGDALAPRFPYFL